MDECFGFYDVQGIMSSFVCFFLLKNMKQVLQLFMW